MHVYTPGIRQRKKIEALKCKVHTYLLTGRLRKHFTLFTETTLPAASIIQSTEHECIIPSRDTDPLTTWSPLDTGNWLTCGHKRNEYEMQFRLWRMFWGYSIHTHRIIIGKNLLVTYMFNFVLLELYSTNFKALKW